MGRCFPAPLSVNVTGLLTTVASGSDIGLSVLADDGTLVGPSDPCDAHANSFSLDNPAGISIGGNIIEPRPRQWQDGLQGRRDLRSSEHVGVNTGAGIQF